jgi:hypothetical protein
VAITNRIGGDAGRPISVNLAETIALSHALIEMADAFLAGHAHASYRRAGGAREQILADDSPIASHAAVTGRPLLTRDPRRVSTYPPGAELISP